MATLSDFNGDESFTIGGNSFNNRESSGTPIYERTGTEGGGGNALGMQAIAWGRFLYGSSGYTPPFYLRHSDNIKYQYFNPSGGNPYYAWVLESPLDNAFVSSTVQWQYNLGEPAQIFKPSVESNEAYEFTIYDITDADMVSVDKGDGMPYYTVPSYTITHDHFNKPWQ